MSDVEAALAEGRGQVNCFAARLEADDLCFKHLKYR